MKFKAQREKYKSRQILEAAKLNADFEFDRFLIVSLAGERFSDGIISGMSPRQGEKGLLIPPGVFKLDGQISWLETAFEIPLPDESRFWRLWLEKTDEPDVYDLSWKDREESGICLCRLKPASHTLLTDHWLYTGDRPAKLSNWVQSHQIACNIQLEYTMAASFGKKPSLLPGLQHYLADFSDNPYLKPWLANGLFLLLDDAASWEEGLEKLVRDIQVRQESREKPIYELRNLAGR